MGESITINYNVPGIDCNPDPSQFRNALSCVCFMCTFVLVLLHVDGTWQNHIQRLGILQLTEMAERDKFIRNS